MDKVFKALHKILFKKAGQNENALRIKRNFLLNDRIFANSYITAAHGESIRHGVINNLVYTFTGKSAHVLNEIGHSIGKKECTGKEYFAKMKELICSRDKYPRLKNHQGDELIMLVNAQEKQTSNGKEINISSLNFVPFRRPLNQPAISNAANPLQTVKNEQKIVQTGLFDNIP